MYNPLKMKEPWVLIGRYPKLPCIQYLETPKSWRSQKSHPRVAQKSTVLQVPNLYIKPQNTSAAFPGTPGAWHGTGWMAHTLGPGFQAGFFGYKI